MPANPLLIGDERIRTAVTVKPDESREKQCVGCWRRAEVTLTLKTGTRGRSCWDCFWRYPHREWVYFLTGGALVKIGTSRSLAERVASHQAGSPIPLIVWHLVEGGRSLERELHVQFANDRAHGEWFRVSPEIRAYVAGASDV